MCAAFSRIIQSGKLPTTFARCWPKFTMRCGAVSLAQGEADGQYDFNSGLAGGGHFWAVSVVIPARNEAENLKVVVPS